MKEIKEKIVGQRVLSKEEAESIEEWDAVLSVGKEYDAALNLHKSANGLPIEVVSEMKRPRRIGNTWRLKPPYSEHALYVTIEAINLNGKKYPYEVFFHGKDISHRQWTDTLTLSWSDTFRKAIEHGFSLSSFIANVQDTNSAEGGYRVVLRDGDKSTYVNGLVSEIGYVLEEFVNECLEFNLSIQERQVAEVFGVPYEAVKRITGSKCTKCGEFAVVNQGGCQVCLECGDTRCE